MNKKVSILLAAMMMSLLVIVPVGGLAEIGNSGTIKKDLNMDNLGHVTINATGLNIEIKEVEEAGGAAYAELDATVIGINSADVSYDLNVSDSNDGTLIEAHHTGSDIGINSVKLNIFVPANQLETLTVDLTDSKIKYDELAIDKIEGTLTKSELDINKTNVGMIDLTLNNDSRLDYDGELSDLNLMANASEVNVDSAIVPATVKVEGTDTKVELKVPETEQGFVLNYDLTDGKMHTNYMDEFNETQGSITHGTGAATFDVTLTNGDLHVNKH